MSVTMVFPHKCKNEKHNKINNLCFMERQPLSFRLVLFILACAFEFAEFIQSMSTPKNSSPFLSRP